MRLILIGAPGAGKGTQAAKLAQRLGIQHVSTGDMFRAAITKSSRLGQHAKKYIDRGDLVPDQTTIPMLIERISERDCQRGFLLDGFPRTLPQAQSLEKALHAIGRGIDRVIYLETPFELIVERITGRRVDPATGDVYHIKYNPPPPDVAPRVIQRDDDSEATLRRRLDRFMAETAAVVPFYESRGVLRRVDGVGEVDAVFERVLQACR